MKYPKATVARLLGVSHQAALSPRHWGRRGRRRPRTRAANVVRGPWPDLRAPLTSDVIIEAHILDVCRDRPRFGTRRVTAMVRRRLGGSGAARGVVNRKRTQRVMRDHGLLVPQRRIPRGEHAGRIEPSRSNELWATDLPISPRARAGCGWSR